MQRILDREEGRGIGELENVVGDEGEPRLGINELCTQTITYYHCIIQRQAPNTMRRRQ